MLLRLLPVTAIVCLSSLVAADDSFDLYSPHDLAVSSPPNSYTLNLSCAECAFSYSDCSENVQPWSFLSITLSTQADTLLVNNDTIFPTPFSMKFYANRFWDVSPGNFETVPLAYALDIQPLPHPPNAVLGDLYRLKLTLVDLQGRPATKSPVSIGLVRHEDGKLEIIEVEESSYHRYHRYLHRGAWGSERGSWRRMKAIKSYFISCLRRTSETVQCASASRVHGRHGVERCREHVKPAGWTGRDRPFLKYVHAVLLPGLFGVIAGILASVCGFLIGKLIVAVWVCCRERRVDTVDDSESAVEEEVVPEKERLVEIYGHRPSEGVDGHS